MADWAVLGPFAIGTREDPWLDAVPDIYAEPVDLNKRYKTALCAYATWKPLIPAKVLRNKVKLDEEIYFDVAFPEVD
jgi:hypothetical protein